MPDPWVGLVFATLLTALLGALCSLLILRGSDLTRLMVTLGVASLLYELANKLDAWTGGADGLQGVTMGPLLGRFDIAWVGIGKYRLFIIAVCALLTLVLQAVLTRTRFGAQLRASVDDPRVAGGLGLNVNRIFLLTFAVGSGLAGLGGALGADVLGLDPGFPLKFMIYFLIVCSVGGTTTITGPLLAALLLGIADVAGKYYVPKLGAFIVYTLMIVILMLRPQGLFARAGSGK
jgi:branched-chain amino acid transport system permease protein